jgi:hypothetical protein
VGAFAGIRRALIGEPDAVPPRLLADFPELSIIRLRRGGLPVRLGGWSLLQSTAAAITLWNVVFLAPGTAPDAELLLHELRHVQQFQSSRAFPFRYLLESLTRGYHQNRYELDAVAFAGARLAAHYRRTRIEES